MVAAASGPDTRTIAIADRPAPVATAKIVSSGALFIASCIAAPVALCRTFSGLADCEGMNELTNAASPYLQQHAGNPVHWRMWTPQALADAKRLGKPILLSVGYAACHWCHVMAHESFEDAETAAVMNELFVNIKVDREERPDVDHIYMSALHAFGQRGGWPLTMFLTPDAQPFWGGTYFPKTARYGQPAFVSVLKSIAQAYRQKPEQIAQNTKAILDHLDADGTSAAPSVTLAEMDGLAARLAGHMDAVNGGMQGAPKFPNPQILEFLWRAADRSDVARCRDLVLTSLDRISQGGIYDHLGGGFSRYSVDDRWLVPHFEKMLYDNAQLLELLALAADATGQALYRERAAETVAWLSREMTDVSGAFCASLDADSEGVEGKFYVWTADEIDDVLGAEDATLFSAAYDVTAAGNWEEPHGPAVTILNRLATPPSGADGEARLGALRAKLLAHRAGRVRPGLDDKILADWNGLMIAALVRSGTLLDRDDWIAMARRAYAAVMDTMAYRAASELRLAHSRRGAVYVRPAFALDYAAMARAALALFEAGCRDRDYLGEASALTDTLLAHHRDPATGLLAMASDDASDVILRLKPTQDDAIPNAHGVTLDALIRLAALSGDPTRLAAADALFDALSGAVQTNFVGHVGVMNSLDLHLRGATIVLAGERRAALREAALRAPYLTRTVIDLADVAALPPDHVARAQAAIAGDAAAFVCRGATCSPPVRDVAALQAALR